MLGSTRASTIRYLASRTRSSLGSSTSRTNEHALGRVTSSGEPRVPADVCP
jgi:hypothetical protein